MSGDDNNVEIEIVLVLYLGDYLLRADDVRARFGRDIGFLALGDNEHA